MSDIDNIKTKQIKRLRSKHYPIIIEVKVPIRFYWNSEDLKDYDGFEFGSLEGCSHHQLKLLDHIINELWYQMNCTKFFKYMKKHHRAELEVLLDHMDADELGIPKEFLDAFRDNKQDD